MTNFFEEELRKLFGNGEVIEAPVFLGGVCAGTLDSDLRVRAEFVATAEKDEYDALLVRVIHRGGGLEQKAAPKKSSNRGGYGTPRRSACEPDGLGRNSRR